MHYAALGRLQTTNRDPTANAMERRNPSSDPQEFRPVVNPRKWTTKVNLAIIVAVTVIFVVGCIWAAVVLTHQEEVQEDMTEELTNP